MQAEVREIGDRPVMFTPGRASAPQAAIRLAQTFEQPGHNWADKADIVIDWQNQLLESDDEALHYPVMLIACSKYVSGKGHLVVQSRLDIDNVFLGDYVTGEVLDDIVNELRIMTVQKLEEAGVS
jgi:hypothetical protein